MVLDFFLHTISHLCRRIASYTCALNRPSVFFSREINRYNEVKNPIFLLTQELHAFDAFEEKIRNPSRHSMILSWLRRTRIQERFLLAKQSSAQWNINYRSRIGIISVRITAPLGFSAQLRIERRLDSNKQSIETISESRVVSFGLNSVSCIFSLVLLQLHRFLFILLFVCSRHTFVRH